jgi:hypothetical protein
MTQIDLSLPVREVQAYKQPREKRHVNKRYEVYKQRVFDWGLKTALLWIIISGLLKQKPPPET